MTTPKPHTRIAVTTQYEDGARTYAIEVDTDALTVPEFAQACKQLALVVGYDPKHVERAFP